MKMGSAIVMMGIALITLGALAVEYKDVRQELAAASEETKKLQNNLSTETQSNVQKDQTINQLTDLNNDLQTRLQDTTAELQIVRQQQEADQTLIQQLQEEISRLESDNTNHTIQYQSASLPSEKQKGSDNILKEMVQADLSMTPVHLSIALICILIFLTGCIRKIKNESRKPVETNIINNEINLQKLPYQKRVLVKMSETQLECYIRCLEETNPSRNNNPNR